MLLADRVKYWLGTQHKFNVFRNSPGWSLTESVADCNKLACDLFIDNHTNAGPVEQKAGDGGAEGTEVFYYHQGGTTSNSYKIASLLYKHIAPISPGKDRGILPDNAYVGSLYVIQKTDPPSALIEHIFHTNHEEVLDMINNIDKYAKAEAKAICEYFNEVWIEPAYSTPLDITSMVQDLFNHGIVTDKTLWLGILNGKVPAKPEFLQVAFSRALNKI
jgi:N-acetylmuramoyl-L-alanine amidase